MKQNETKQTKTEQDKTKLNGTKRNKTTRNEIKRNKTVLISNSGELKMVPMNEFDYLYKIYIGICFKRKLVSLRIH